MTHSGARTCTTPRDGDLGLRHVTNAAGLAVSVLPNGSLFAIEHQHERGRIMLNQVLGSPIGGGIARLYLRIGGREPRTVRVGPGTADRFAAAADRLVWEGKSAGLQHRVTLWLHARSNVWLWHLELANRGTVDLPCDAILAQDLGLGGRGFLMNNEAYVSQYIDHHIAVDARLGPVVM
ncbi:MAG TPA: cellobiose phosphorylase, partial [Candidatus Angelobacter sp.]|nr:cellobiose phosphorylase [Candidatus Angelobacter sp.]